MLFERNDQVQIFGKTWRVDWRDMGWIGISNDEGEHKEVHVNALERDRQIEDIVRRAE
jgi:hypothetical protein